MIADVSNCYRLPARILIAGGKPAGGVASFAEALRCGFVELGLQADVVRSSAILRRPAELGDPSILKILSLSSLFASPIARRAVCVAHGFPCAAHQGWAKTLAILASLRLAVTSRGAQLIAVSNYSGLHLHAIFALRIDGVIHNPLHPCFLLGASGTLTPVDRVVRRQAITYVGRLHRAKNIDRLLPSMRDVLDENPGAAAWIIGDGPLRSELESLVSGDSRFQFLGTLEPGEVRERLRRSRLLVSANPTEPFGIVYLEALSQGCAVVMPASGGGLEIAPELIGRGIWLFPPAMRRSEIAAALREAFAAPLNLTVPSAYSARKVAQAYLDVDARFNAQGMFYPDQQQGREAYS